MKKVLYGLIVVAVAVAAWSCIVERCTWTKYKYRNDTSLPIVMRMYNKVGGPCYEMVRIEPGQEWGYTIEGIDDFVLEPFWAMPHIAIFNGTDRVDEWMDWDCPTTLFDIDNYEVVKREGRVLYLQFVFTDAYFGRE